ncbi:MAG: glycosyl transferase family 1 [Bacteroidia bacterium]|nr:MAG: glycosyl transferase family 1 [Bacteroidia bacterium]
MRIGFDAKRAFYNHSGLGNYSRSTIEILAKYHPHGEYFLFTPSLKKSIPFPIAEKLKIVEPQSFIDKTFSSYWRTFRLSKEIKKAKIDLYHGLSGELPYNAERGSCRMLVTIHDLIFMRYPEFYKRIDREVYRQKAEYACREADKIIAISEQTKSDIIRFFDVNEEKIELVYQGCNTIFQKEISPEQKIKAVNKYKLPPHYVLNVGTVEKRKNSLLILKAIHEGKIDTSLVIVGKWTKYQEDLIAYAEEHDLQERLVIINDIDFADLPAVYAQAEIFIYPSFFEGFGIPIIEAMFCKVPVITTRGGVFSETGGFSSLYVDVQNVEEMIDAMKKVLSQPDLQKKMSEEGYRYVQKFRDEEIAGNLAEVYQY